MSVQPFTTNSQLLHMHLASRGHYVQKLSVEPYAVMVPSLAATNCRQIQEKNVTQLSKPRYYRVYFGGGWVAGGNGIVHAGVWSGRGLKSSHYRVHPSRVCINGRFAVAKAQLPGFAECGRDFPQDTPRHQKLPT
ncbi:hypothetical protein CBL_05313 [Carabus blaptoides fortunei]